MNGEGAVQAFMVTLSDSPSARIEMICVNADQKKIHVFWIRRGQSRRRAFDFEKTALARSPNKRRLVVTCRGDDGKVQWKKAYYFKTAQFRECFCQIISPTVTLQCPKLMISYHPLYDKKNNDWKLDGKGKGGLLANVRHAVSLKKRRFVHGKYDLDLTYVTPRIISMGIPSEGNAATYRNPMTMVQNFMNEFHGEDYLVVNLCEADRQYPKERFGGRVANFPFEDHNPPPFNLLVHFCNDMQNFLDEDDKNVIAVHCKAGKGRTGTVVATLLSHFNAVKTPYLCTLFFAQRRTYNAQGVTIPSQIRYIYYYFDYQQALQMKGKSKVTTIEPASVVLDRVLMSCPPVGISAYVTIWKYWTTRNTTDPRDMIMHKEEIYNGKPTKETALPPTRAGQQELTLTLNKELAGDYKIIFWDTNREKELCHVWLNTSFVDPNTCTMSILKGQVDKARKDTSCKTFPHNFALQLLFDKKSMLGESNKRIDGSSVNLIKLPGSVQKAGFEKIRQKRLRLATVEKKSESGEQINNTEEDNTQDQPAVRLGPQKEEPVKEKEKEKRADEETGLLGGDEEDGAFSI